MTESIICYCGSVNKFSECCEPYIKGTKIVENAETLMRSRYSAYVVCAIDYLWTTTAVQQRKYHNKSSMLDWAKSNQWVKLEILKVAETTVEFKAYYLDAQLKAQIHYEKSTFTKEQGKWYYVDGEY